MNMGAKASEVAFWIESGNTPSIAELKYVLNLLELEPHKSEEC